MPNYLQHKTEAIQIARWILTALIIGMLLAFFFAPHARADESLNLETLPVIGRLDNTQKILYLTVLAAVDYHQTVETVVKQPDPYPYYETNPILGRHPSRRNLALFGVVGVAATALISHVNHPLARILVDSIVATEQVNVWSNERVQTNKHTIDRNTTLPIIILISHQF